MITKLSPLQAEIFVSLQRYFLGIRKNGTPCTGSQRASFADKINFKNKWDSSNLPTIANFRFRLMQ